jgi:hypothetical protein
MRAWRSTTGSSAGAPRLTEHLGRKVARALTDADALVRHDPERKPGVFNLGSQPSWAVAASGGPGPGSS